MSGSWLEVPSVEAPLPRNVAKPSTDQIYNLLRAEREVEVRARRTRETANTAGKGGANGGRNSGGPLPPLGLRTYPNRQGVAVQIEDEGTSLTHPLHSLFLPPPTEDERSKVTPSPSLPRPRRSHLAGAAMEDDLVSHEVEQ